MNFKSLSALSMIVCGALNAFGAPPNKPHFDGHLIEYDATDLRGTFAGVPAWPSNEMSNLYVTWDETNLYVALECEMVDNKISVLMDIDPGNGTGATTTTNWLDGDNVLFVYNDNGWQVSDAPGATPFGLDFNIATEGWYNSVTLALYDGVVVPSTNNGARLFDMLDVGNGSVPIGTAVEMVVLKDSTENPYKGFETRIPWNTLYGSNTNRFGIVGPGQVVPTGATIRLFANIHNNSNLSSYSAPDTIPEQTSPNASYNAGLLITDNYIDVMIDQDNDGFPDLAAHDVNAPYISRVIGVVGSTTATCIFNEAVAEWTVETTSNWNFGGFTVLNTEKVYHNVAKVTLDGPLPSNGTLVVVQTTNIKDLSGNSKAAGTTFSTQPWAFNSISRSMTAAGTFQGWDASERNMTLIADHTWIHDRMLNSSNGIMFKFAAGTWGANWGLGTQDSQETPLIGSAHDFFGTDIIITNETIGMHRFVFNDETFAFSCVRIDADSDNDTLPDGWETFYGMSPIDDGSGSVMNGPYGDNDADGFENKAEFGSDTSPNDPYSFLAVYSISRTPSDRPAITFPTSTNRTYTVEFAPDASSQGWTAVPPTNIPGTAEPITVTHTTHALGHIYRILVRKP